MAKYKNIPVDEETAGILLELCEAYEFGQRGQGAMVKKLAKAEYQTLKEAKLLPSQNRKRAVVVKIVKKLEAQPVAEAAE